jgi:hypothetical protein
MKTAVLLTFVLSSLIRPAFGKISLGSAETFAVLGGLYGDQHRCNRYQR